MDNMLRQLRVIFDLPEDEEKQIPKREGRIPPQKTVSFKEEQKKLPNWFQIQFPRMSRDSYSGDGEHEAAVAAAAFAITAIEEEILHKQKKITKDKEASLTKMKSRKESAAGKTKDSDTVRPTGSGRISRWFTNKETKEDEQSAGERSMRKSGTEDQKKLRDEATDQKSAEKALGTTPSIRRTTTSTGKSQTDGGSKRYGGVKEKPAPVPLPSIKPTVSSATNATPTKTLNSESETMVDAWESAKMEKIKKRYEKMGNTILSWENEKKIKAKKRLDKIERRLELRRTRALQEYRNKISRIDQIASGARAVAEEKKRNDESKAREKTTKIRSKGRVPKCFCF
ncbi:hypothetical protein QJS10_CPA10g02033 [Acorus calamus]|uniref:Remorin C-terminal domain-containing protein n=1 Tax=Acorus calamus TaxID=4465 RepID=A0AAV9DXS3_ACOCL|nr:hypothetical protein QJS10_CPA10g02033 [Acorus calamus]